jgi:DNA-3-methyladenine glycosylase II
VPDADTEAPPLPAPERAALRRLVARDPLLAGIEAQAGPLPWRTREPGFPGLLAAIVGQQISNLAAAAIWRRVVALMDGSPSAEALLALPDAALAGAGLSRPKIAYARGLAEAVATGRLDPSAFPSMPDEEVIAAIIALPGFGRWSAEIYLLFALGRRDAFPAADLALAAAAAHLYGFAARPGEKALRALAEPWAPWRGLAARLLWHHWRHVNRRPAAPSSLPSRKDPPA